MTTIDYGWDMAGKDVETNKQVYSMRQIIAAIEHFQPVTNVSKMHRTNVQSRGSRGGSVGSLL
jgi:hypothetical protein